MSFSDGSYNGFWNHTEISVLLRRDVINAPFRKTLPLAEQFGRRHVNSALNIALINQRQKSIPGLVCGSACCGAGIAMPVPNMMCRSHKFLPSL